MTNVLVLDQHTGIAEPLINRLRQQPNLHVTELEDRDFKRAGTYLKALANQNVIVSLLGPMDLDLDFEALFGAIDQIQPPIKQFVVLSHAGVDDRVEKPVKYSGIKDVREYLNEQCYAVKVVDESEIPYTILRPVTLTNDSKQRQSTVIEEGQTVPQGTVSKLNVARIAAIVIINHRYVNQSIAIIDQMR